MEVNEQGIKAFAETLVEKLAPYTSHATVVALKGELGAGKTTFTKYFAEALGVEEVITSPTFVIEKVYKLEGQRFEYLIHIDAYRLEGGDELMDLGWEEVLAQPENLVVIEWPEKVHDVIPLDVQTITFEVVDEETRKITHNE